jgi:hypothetical protein
VQIFKHCVVSFKDRLVVRGPKIDEDERAAAPFVEGTLNLSTIESITVEKR